MPNTKVETLRLGPWVGGSKPDFSPFVLSPQDVSVAVNVDFREDGSIRKRRGYAKWSTSDPAAANWGRFLWSWKSVQADTPGNDFLFYADADNELYYVDATAGTTLTRANHGTDITLGTSIIGFAAMDDVAYFTSRGTGIDVVSFDGSTWTNIADVGIDGTGPEFPPAFYLLNKHERIFAANIHTNSIHYPSRIWWSNAGDAETWGTTSWIDIDPDNGSSITGLASYGDRIIIFKEDSFYILGGTDPDSFTLFQMSSSVGCKDASRTIVEVEGMLMWFDYATQTVWSFDGAEYIKIDDPIRERIREGISVGHHYSHRAHAFAFNGKYYLSLNWEEAGANAENQVKHTFVYDVRKKQWSEYDLGINGAAMIDGTLYTVGHAIGDVTPSIGIFTTFDESYVDDAGSNISCHFDTPWLAPDGDFTMDFRVRRLQAYLRGEATNPATVTVALHTDWDGTTEVSSNSISNSSTDDYVVGEVEVASTPVQAYSVHVENDSADEWEVSAIDCVVSRRMREQGVES